jgi:predicted dehydrogenase
MEARKTTRREFLKQTLTAGMGLLFLKSGFGKGQSPNDKLNIAIIGTGGRGWDNLMAVSSEHIVALCDVDLERLAPAAQAFPKAALYVDYRRMLERQRNIDAVVISTPDHHHALPALIALQLGKHVYCEKPLVHSVWEARAVREAARRAKVATQMGNQAHASDNLRRAVEIVRSGVIGAIREVHCWTDRPIWPQGIDRPTETPPIPSTLFWDLWLGPAPARPYHPAYHPFAWRGWWDFGTGALGDMGCHIIDTAYWALELGLPVSVEAEGEPRHPETGPKWSIVQYEFPARKGMPPVRLIWYDGGRKPRNELVEGKPLAPNGTLFVGEKGVIYFPHADRCFLFPQAKFADFQPPAPSIPRSPAGHHAEWIQACKTGSPTFSHFEYAATLTEAVLLGNVAFRVGQKIFYDAQQGRVTNVPEAERYVRPPYRKGWGWW